MRAARPRRVGRKAVASGPCTLAKRKPDVGRGAGDRPGRRLTQPRVFLLLGPELRHCPRVRECQLPHCEQHAEKPGLVNSLMSLGVQGGMATDFPVCI